MYGLLLESVADCVREKWGETVWLTLVEQAGIGWGGFSIHNVYSELHIERVAKTLSKIVFLNENEIMFKFGAHFMTFVAGYGYDQVTKVLGRKLCDFINGLDNLHDYISNLYKEIRPPSFYVEKEDDRGLIFHYHTPRKYPAFVHYVRGMVTTAARIYYKMADFSVAVVKEELLEGGMHAIYRVTYANNTLGVQGPWMPVLRKLRQETPLTVNSDVVFNSFPFSIIFSESMEVLSCGAGVVKSFPTLVGKKITDFFVLTKPFGIPFTWDFMRNRPVNVLVEMTSTVALWAEYEEYLRSQEILDPENAPPPPNRNDSPPLKLRGTTAYLESWNSVIFMCTPVFESLETMNDIGLYISDLSFQDSVQVLLVAGPQQSAELKIALDMEQGKNSKLEETLGELDKENKKTDALLFSMIPREIAERLKKGESPINIAETFPEVTVLFSDVVGFTNICSRITPMEVVAILNQIYTVFDTLSERYEVFKVETIGDGYMAVSGAPVRTKMHAQHICDMALEMQAGIRHLKDPWTGASIRIRIGIHSGGVVAGVVGQKMIRYCLFGDTVNTASRMESCGEGCEIHISKTVRDRLMVSGAYKIEDRGMIYIKGKGQMRTYWLKGRNLIKRNSSSGLSFMESLVSQTTGVSPSDQKNALKMLHPVLDISPVENENLENLPKSVPEDVESPGTSQHFTTMVPSTKPAPYDSSADGKDRSIYNSENSMSFRQALEEIVDIQTKEMVAYQEGHSVGPEQRHERPASEKTQMLSSIRNAEGTAYGVIEYEEEKLPYDCEDDIEIAQTGLNRMGGDVKMTKHLAGRKNNMDDYAKVRVLPLQRDHVDEMNNCPSENKQELLTNGKVEQSGLSVFQGSDDILSDTMSESKESEVEYVEAPTMTPPSHTPLDNTAINILASRINVEAQQRTKKAISRGYKDVYPKKEVDINHFRSPIATTSGALKQGSGNGPRKNATSVSTIRSHSPMPKTPRGNVEKSKDNEKGKTKKTIGALNVLASRMFDSSESMERKVDKSSYNALDHKRRAQQVLANSSKKASPISQRETKHSSLYTKHRELPPLTGADMGSSRSRKVVVQEDSAAPDENKKVILPPIKPSFTIGGGKLSLDKNVTETRSDQVSQQSGVCVIS